MTKTPREKKPIPENATLEQRFVKCGKPRCGTCAKGGPMHGPYWYAYWKDGTRVRTRYLGVKISEAQFQAKRKKAAARALGKPSDDRALATIRRYAKRRNGLAFLPDVVREMGGRAIAHPILLRLAREERIELRPESGLNRLTRIQRGLCPPGPQGTVLSWARSMS